MVLEMSPALDLQDGGHYFQAAQMNCGVQPDKVDVVEHEPEGDPQTSQDEKSAHEFLPSRIDVFSEMNRPSLRTKMIEGISPKNRNC